MRPAINLIDGFLREIYCNSWLLVNRAENVPSPKIPA